MATRRRHPTDLRDYRSVLYSDGELSVGAYARSQRRKRILLGLAGAGLIGGAVWLHMALRPTPIDTVDSEVPVYVQCIMPGCGYRGLMHVDVGDEGFPIVCPQCGQKSCQPQWVCRDCGERFLARGRQAEVVCPRCGSLRVGVAEERAAEAGED